MQETPWNEMEMILKPVGYVRSDITAPMLTTGEGDLELAERKEKIRVYHQKVKKTVCELVIDPALSGILEGIEDFSHIMVLYWPHLIPEARRGLRRVHPMGRKDMPVRGIFATCSPARPNPILVSTVPLVDVAGSVLRVRGLEAVDGSPIVDIKPFSRDYHGAENVRVPAWMEQIRRELEDEDIEY